jgi:hypothetical protein
MDGKADKAPVGGLEGNMDSGVPLGADEVGADIDGGALDPVGFCGDGRRVGLRDIDMDMLYSSQKCSSFSRLKHSEVRS